MTTTNPWKERKSTIIQLFISFSCFLLIFMLQKPQEQKMRDTYGISHTIRIYSEKYSKCKWPTEWQTESFILMRVWHSIDGHIWLAWNSSGALSFLRTFYTKGIATMDCKRKSNKRFILQFINYNYGTINDSIHSSIICWFEFRLF